MMGKTEFNTRVVRKEEKARPARLDLNSFENPVNPSDPLHA